MMSQRHHPGETDAEITVRQTTRQLERGLGLGGATAVNMIEMVGIGPFIVIPFVVGALQGRAALWAWVAGAILAACDACVWAELGAAMPEAGGTYVFLRECYGPGRCGRLLSFLYIWQTLFLAPLIIASGALGFADYSAYLAGRHAGPNYERIVAAAVIAAIVALLYRKIGAVGKISMVFWAVVVATMAWLIWAGLAHAGAHRLVEQGLEVSGMAGGGWLSWAFAAALGHATVQTVYSYLGYYNVCNLGAEMKDPARNIPRAIFLSVAGITVLYLLLQTSVVGAMPWQDAAHSRFIVSTMMERFYGSRAGSLATVLILITAAGSVFSATLGYSRVPYAAALDGNFFGIFGRVHPKKRFPHVSLLALGAAAIVFSLAFSLFSVIRALIAMRCLVQFAAQGIGLVLLRRRQIELPFRMRLYPLPVVVSVAGWILLFWATGRRPIEASLGVTAAGILVYLGRALLHRQWPFAHRIAENPE